MTMFQNFKFDPTSFLIGLVAGLLVWLLSNTLKKVLPQLRQSATTTIKRSREALTGGAARYVRFAVMRKAQKAHLASALFALDEVVIPPRFLAPAAAENVLTGLPGETSLPKIFPYLPSWPELASQYYWPALSASEILQNGANIAIIGKPGSGKSVALAYLALKLARKDLDLVDMVECVPLYIHIHELGDLATCQGLYSETVQIYQKRAPIYARARLPGYLSGQARAGDLVFLLDGLDQLNAPALSAVTRLIAADLKTYPKLRIAVSANPDYLDGLLNLGFQPLSLASWNLNERLQFANQWARKWEEAIVPQIKKQIPNYEAGQLFIQNWTQFEGPQFTPLDWTLKIWSLYCGDAAGSSTINSLEAYIGRTSKNHVPLDSLASLALKCLQSETGIITQTEAETILTSRPLPADLPVDPAASEPQPGATKERDARSATSNTGKKVSISARVLAQLTANGILAQASENSYYFAQPTILGYLGSLCPSDDPTAIDLNKQNPADEWLLHFLAAQNQASPFIQTIIQQSEPPYFDGLFTICRWLKDCPLSSEWRTILMRQVMKILAGSGQIIDVRPTIISALVAANDPAVFTLFHQMLTSPDETLRIFAALGCGALQDTKSIHEIAMLLEDSSMNVRLAACLALGIIRSPASTNYITSTFQEGDETLKQVAAESLTFLGEGGYTVLREGYASESLILRRAVVFGLANVKQDWARQMLEEIAIQDAQWVVRNAAAQGLEIFNKPNPFIPTKLPAPAQSGWLIAFAARQGVGVPPDTVPVEMLYSVLENGTEDERICALDYLRLLPNDEVIQKVYALAAGEKGAMKDSALLALWYLRACGVRLSIASQ